MKKEMTVGEARARVANELALAASDCSPKGEGADILYEVADTVTSRSDIDLSTIFQESVSENPIIVTEV